MTLFSRAAFLTLLTLLSLSACSHQEPASLSPPPRAAKASALPDPSIADAADRAVERSVRELLELAGVSTFDVFVRSRRGRVTLTGQVPTAATAESLVSLTGRLKNVRGVRPELDIVPAVAGTPVAAEAEPAFAWQWPLLALFTLILGYAIGRRRRRRDEVLPTTNVAPTNVREVPPSRSRAS